MQHVAARATSANDAAAELGGGRLRAARWVMTMRDAAWSGLAGASGTRSRRAGAGDEEPELAERRQSCSRGAGAAREEPGVTGRSRSSPGGREELEQVEGGRGHPGGVGAAQANPERAERSRSLRGEAGAAGEGPCLPGGSWSCAREASSGQLQNVFCICFCTEDKETNFASSSPFSDPASLSRPARRAPGERRSGGAAAIPLLFVAIDALSPVGGGPSNAEAGA